MSKKIEAPKEPQVEIEETEEIELISEPTPTKQNLFRGQKSKLDSKLDLSPIVDKLNEFSEKLEKVLNPKKESKESEIAPPEAPHKRKYQYFDEFDPTLEME